MINLALPAPLSTFTRSGQGETVWVVSSEAHQVHQLSELLEDAGYGAVPLASAAAVIAQAAIAPPDLVVLDTALSDLSGFELARRPEGDGANQSGAPDFLGASESP